MIVKSKLTVFVLFSFAFSWISSLPLYFVKTGIDSPLYFLIAVLYMAGPMAAAVAVKKFIYKEELKESLGITFRLNLWFLFAWILPVIISTATMGISLVFPEVEYSPKMEGMFERFGYLLSDEQIASMENQIASMTIPPFWIALLQGLAAGVTVNTVLGFGEELGWRGLMQGELKSTGFWKASLIIGTVWGIWHAPLILQGHNFPDHPVAGVFMMILWCILISPLFGLIRIKSGSVISAAVFHGSLNATGGLSVLMLKGGSDLNTGLTGFPGIIVLLIINFVLYIFITVKSRGAREYSYIS